MQGPCLLLCRALACCCAGCNGLPPLRPAVCRDWQCLLVARQALFRAALWCRSFPVGCCVSACAGLNKRELLQGINHMATARFMHVIAPHPETGGWVDGWACAAAAFIGLLYSCMQARWRRRCALAWRGRVDRFNGAVQHALQHGAQSLAARHAGKHEEVLRLGMGVLMEMMVQRMEAAAAGGSNSGTRMYLYS